MINKLKSLFVLCLDFVVVVVRELLRGKAATRVPPVTAMLGKPMPTTDELLNGLRLAQQTKPVELTPPVERNQGHRVLERAIPRHSTLSANGRPGRENSRPRELLYVEPPNHRGRVKVKSCPGNPLLGHIFYLRVEDVRKVISIA